MEYVAERLDCDAGATASIDSARANLAGTFVNAFVNAGFGNDKLMVDVEDGQSYIYKNKDHGGFTRCRRLLGMLLRLFTRSRYDERHCIPWYEHVMGLGRWC